MDCELRALIVEDAKDDNPSLGQLRVLIVEDLKDDVELLLLELARGGYEVEHQQVQTEDAMRRALAEHSWDLVLSDFAMPGFSAPAALAVLKEVGLDIPFMIVSGAIGEEIAVEALKAGAHDFLVKGRLARLIPAVERELREVNVRRRQCEAEEALRASEERFRAVTDTAADAVVSASDDGNIVYMNRAAENMFGYAAAELNGQPLTRLMPERFQAAHRIGLARYLETGVGHMVGRTTELTGQRSDGSEFPIDLSLASWKLAGKTYFTAIIRDVSDRKEMEAQLLVSDRMASVGTLAAGVAHEINNPLAIIIANLDLTAREAAELAERFGDIGEHAELLNDARSAAERVRLIVRDLKLFSRAEEDRQGPVNIERVIESSLRMAWNEIRHRARVVTNYGKVPLVNGNESRLGQVFLNLIVNAVQAIREGNTRANEIRVTTRTDTNGRVIVDVADTGPGIRPDVLKRLFTPFFTTKPVGVGTGLGLSICQRIVSSLGGEIAVESTVGTGTVFHVTLLPARLEQALEMERPPAAMPAARRGRVLIIDDERLITRAVTRILAPAHDVVALTSGEEALARIRKGERFDVILSDLMMPQMTGMDLHAALTRVDRAQAERMIFLTGGAFTPQARAFLDSVTNERIEKPFDAMHLRNIINDRIR